MPQIDNQITQKWKAKSKLKNPQITYTRYVFVYVFDWKSKWKFLSHFWLFVTHLIIFL